MTPPSASPRSTPRPPGQEPRAGAADAWGADAPSEGLLRDLLASSLILVEDWERLPAQTRHDLMGCTAPEQALQALVRHGLLTDYQAGRLEAGTASGLILGSYRVLDRLGAGGMGVVFKAEHLRLRRPVAVKVLPLSADPDPRLLQRFFAEMRAVAQLQHPNIVGAIDAGEATGPDPAAPPLHYFVMEYVPGQDLEEAVRQRGPLPAAEACGLAYQVASALAEAHRHDLVHRDLKPSNVRVTPDGQAKLLDFGLVRRFSNRLTEPGTVLGTLDYLAPEQARDPRSVDGRADLYALGGMLFWCLTGRVPFPAEGNLVQEMVRRQAQPPPSARAVRPELPEELDAVLARMMACRPEDRYPTAQAVMNALLAFLGPAQPGQAAAPGPALAGRATAAADPEARPHRVLVVDDSPTSRRFSVYALGDEGIACDEAGDAEQALRALAARVYDVVVTDWVMPGLTGLELCRRLRECPPAPHLKVIVYSGQLTDDEVAQVLAAGADDYLTKQFSPVQLVARVRAALRHKDAQGRADLLHERLLAVNRQLEQDLAARDCDLVHVRGALVLGLADLAAHRDGATVARCPRLQRYCRSLAEQAAGLPGFAGQISEDFVRMLECCAPLHDIGKAGLPDHLLLKPGNLTAEERLMLEAHTALGAETLQRVAQRHGRAVAFLGMAIDIARHHHERYDGKGYPDRLAGSDIPLAARLVAIGDAYDGLRCRQAYKPALSHAAALDAMLRGSPGQFDPLLLHAFERCASQFEQIFREVRD